jgi:hypothetical protein
VQPIRSEKIKQWFRDRPRSDALVLRAVPASIVKYRLKNCLTLSASSTPSLGFHCVTHRMNIPYEHSNHLLWISHCTMNRIYDKIISTDPALETLCFLCLCAPMTTAITQIHFETGGGGANRFHGPYSQYRVDSFQARAALTNRNSRVSKNEGAELWCASWEGQIHNGFARALLIRSTSTSYDHKRDLPSFLSEY